MIALHIRVAALDAVRPRFVGKVLDWGTIDCVQFPNACLREAGASAVEIGAYHDLKGALRELSKLGAESLFEAVDDRFERIPLARALPCDLVGFEADGDGPLDSIALGVFAGGGRAFAFKEDGLATLNANAALLCWRAA